MVDAGVHEFTINFGVHFIWALNTYFVYGFFSLAQKFADLIMHHH